MLNANDFNANKTPKKFNCINCDFECSKRSDYERHILTRKHNNANDANKKTEAICNKCSLVFKHASSLSRHRKTCNEKNKMIQQEQNISFVIDEIKDTDNDVMINKKNT
jgi:hypothetical protein